MAKPTITRERLEELASGQSGFNLRIATLEESQQLASMALAAMDSEPMAIHMGEAINVFKAIKGEQLSERVTNADTGPMGASNVQVWTSKIGCILEFISANGGCTLNIFPQPTPVVPQDVLEALQKVARIRLDMNDFDGDRRGIADCLCDAEEALIEVVNRRAAMLAAAPQSPGSDPATVPGKWIPVSERMPESNGVYFGWDGKRVLEVNCFFGGFSANQFIHGEITHWMPLPAGPQEVR